MGKVALLAIAAFTVMGVYYGATSQSGMMATQATEAVSDYMVMARNVAQTGYSLGKQKLSGQTFSCSPIPNFSGPYQDNGFYNVQYWPCTSNAVTVKSLGTIYGPDAQYNFNISASFEKVVEWKQPSIAPAFMEYALISDKDLTINGTFLVDTTSVGIGDVAGATRATYNANIHTNGMLTVKGNSARIRGYGTYKTSANVQHPSVFRPYDIKDHSSIAVVRVPDGVPIPIDDYDPDQFWVHVKGDEEIAKGNALFTKSAGDVVLSGTYDFTDKGATREHPYVWYIGGNLSSNGAKLTGYVTFLVKGNVDFGGNVEVGKLVGPAESNYAFYTSGDIKMHGNSTVIWGQMVAKGNVTLSGTPKIFGSVVAYGTFTGNGTPDIYYFPPSPALASPVEETRWKRVSYVEREGV